MSPGFGTKCPVFGTKTNTIAKVSFLVRSQHQWILNLTTTCTVTLNYGEQEREIMHEKITTHSIALVFNLNPLLFGCRSIMDTVFTFLVNT